MFLSPGKSKGSASALFAGLTIIAAMAVLALAVAMPSGRRVVVVANPWASETAAVSIIAEAGGRIIAMGRQDFLAVAESDEDGFTGRLLSAGAWLVLEGRLAAACFRENQT